MSAASAGEDRPARPEYPAARRADRAWFARPVHEVAVALLDAVVVSTTSDGVVAVRLTEVEAYAGEADPGSHAFRGRTPRNAVMFGPAGHLYVYRHMGLHHCANVVTGVDGVASAVLLRAGEVVEGHDLARSRRTSSGVVRRDADLARGPARLAVALGLDMTWLGTDLTGATAPLTAVPGRPVTGWRTGPRVGVAGPGGDGEAYPWRYWLDGDPTVSVFRPGAPRRRRPSTPPPGRPGGTAH